MIIIYLAEDVSINVRAVMARLRRVRNKGYDDVSVCCGWVVTVYSLGDG